MKTNHEEYVSKPQDRPQELPLITPDNLVKAKYQEGDRLCYTGWLLEIFLQDDQPYTQAYKQFRTKTMDVLYGEYSDDHASNAEQRSAVFNKVASGLGYKQIPTKEWLKKYRRSI